MYSRAVLTSHLYLPRGELGATRIKFLKRELTAERKYEGSPIIMYSEVGGWFGAPLHHWPNPAAIAEEVIDKRTAGFPTNMRFTGTLWQDQERVLEQFKMYFEGGKTGVVLESPPGSGKTVLAISMMAKLAVTTLVVVPRSNLIKQWIERLVAFSNLTRRDIGVVEGGKYVYKDRKVVIALVHSLALDRLGPDFRKYFGCVVFDEVDRSVPPTTFAPVIQMFPSKYRIGLSATMKRQDGLEVVFEKHIGQCYIQNKKGQRMKPTVLMVHFTGNSGHIHPGSRKLNRRGMLLSRISKNVARNIMTAKLSRMMYNSDRQCLILSDRTEQLVALRELLIQRYKVPRNEVGFYVHRLPVLGQTTDSGKQAYRKLTKRDHENASACKIVLGTFGMIALGTDIPSLSGLIYATPQSEVTQSKGRIERVLEGKKEPIVVDIVDTYYKDTMRWAKKREKSYIAEGLKIKVLK